MLGSAGILVYERVNANLVQFPGPMTGIWCYISGFSAAQPRHFREPVQIKD